MVAGAEQLAQRNESNMKSSFCTPRRLRSNEKLHAHICRLYDVGPDYLVMEYIEGSLLRGPMAADEVQRLAIQSNIEVDIPTSITTGLLEGRS